MRAADGSTPLPEWGTTSELWTMELAHDGVVRQDDKGGKVGPAGESLTKTPLIHAVGTASEQVYVWPWLFLQVEANTLNLVFQSKMTSPDYPVNATDGPRKSSTKYRMFPDQNYDLYNIYDKEGNVDHGGRVVKSAMVGASCWVG